MIVNEAKKFPQNIFIAADYTFLVTVSGIAFFTGQQPAGIHAWIARWGHKPTRPGQYTPEVLLIAVVSFRASGNPVARHWYRKFREEDMRRVVFNHAGCEFKDWRELSNKPVDTMNHY